MQNAEHHQWHENLNAADYVRAIYEVTANCDGELAALKMARSLNVDMVGLNDAVESTYQQSSSLRVVRVSELHETAEVIVTTGDSNAAGEGARESAIRRFAIEIACRR